jgi:hypothetical protein
MDANPSFEQPITPWWKITNGSASREQGGPQGLYFARLIPSSSSAEYVRLHRDVLVYAPGSHDAATYVRKDNDADTGKVFLSVKRRPYTVGTDFCTPAPDGDYRFTTEVGISPTNSWTLYSTAASSYSYQRLGLRVTLRNEMSRTVDGRRVLVQARIDDLRVRAR